MKTMMTVTALAVMAWMTLGCECRTSAPPEKATTPGPTTSAPVVQEEQYRFGFIIYGSQGNPFWTKVVAGVEEACDKLGCKASIQYAQNDPIKQNNIAEMMIAKKVDGIALCLSNSDSYDKVVQEAIDLGMAVVAFNIDDVELAEGNARMAYIGQDMTEAGDTIAQRLIDDGGLKSGDHVVCPVESPEAVYAVQRYAGAKRAFDRAGITSEKIKTGTESLDKTLNRIKQYLLAHPETDAILGMGGMPLQMAPSAADDMDLDLPIAGFDISKVIAEDVKTGRIIATVDQQPFYQGFMAIMQMYYNRKYGLLPCDVNTGGGLVDQGNIDKVIELSDTVR